MIDKKDVIIEYFRASGPGGQRRNKKDTAVRITHIATGLKVVATESRYRIQNLKKAFSRLEEKIKNSERKAEPRIATKIPRRAKERRLVKKKYRGFKKSLRRRIDLSENGD